MLIAGVAVLLFVLFFGCRWIMFQGIRQCTLDKQLKVRCALCGAAQEWAITALVFVLCFNLQLSLPPEWRFAAIILFLFYILGLAFLSIVDAAIYQRATRRLDKAVFGNTNLVSLKAILHWREVCLLLVTSAFLALLGTLAGMGMARLGPSGAWTAALALLLSVVIWQYTRNVAFTKEDFIQHLSHQSDWINMKISMFVAEDVNTIMRSAVLCFADIFLTRRGFAPYAAKALTPEEERYLKDVKLLREESAPKIAFTPKRYKRIIIVEVESLARDLLPMYNPKIPKETTPFLGYIHRRFHAVNNYYASSSPTELALMAMLGSRLRDSWEYEDVNQQTLFSILRALDYKTYFLQCTTGLYNNHHKKNPAVLKPEFFIADEQLREDFPKEPRNDWGFQDAVLYKKALQLLNRNKENPVCVFVSTVNTHAPYWFSYTKFPESIEATQYRCLRSLYQTDCELAEFFSNLRSLNLFDDDTLLIITADHNPHFGGEYPELTGQSYYPNLIPLFFVTAAPGPFNAIPRTTLSCQLDFLPTFCDAMGLPIPSTALGESMFAQPERRFIIQQVMPSRVDFNTYGYSFSVDYTEKPTSTEDSARLKWFAAKLRAAGAA